MKRKFDFIKMVETSPEADLITNFIKYRFQRGFSTLGLVIGARGTGKSSTCYRLDEKANEILNPLREKLGLQKKDYGTMIDSHLELLKFVSKSEMGETAILEEISVLYPSRRSMSEESVAFSKVLDTIRKKRLIIFANTPMALSSDKNIRNAANFMLQTYKILKSESVVISRLWKLQTNYMMGKTYMHKFYRGGHKVDFMFTKMPSMERWEEYERQKDDFISSQYERFMLKARNKEEKELKELGLAPVKKGELTGPQLRVAKLLPYHNQKEIAEITGLSPSEISRKVQQIKKKGYAPEDFKKNNDIGVISVKYTPKHLENRKFPLIPKVLTNTT